ncbi:MAG: hypothetical protein OEY67_04190, partial [Gammaproteobacteria bacterium]|nr:hypothetical protein [Gammaproteobacteria bacterium]
MTLTREKLSLSLLLAGFILVMTATRYHHFGSVLHMPDASLAVFFFAGLYLKKLRFFAVFLATAGIVDFLAIRV